MRIAAPLGGIIVSQVRQLRQNRRVGRLQEIGPLPTSMNGGRPLNVF